MKSTMKKIIFPFLILVSLFTIVSCGTMEKSDRISRRNDFFNMFSKTELKATSSGKIRDDILVLRKNKTFRYYSKILGLVDASYYSGTFKKINDSTMVFEFYKNYKPSFFINDTLKISKKDNFETLENSNDYLVIKENRLK